MTQQPPSSDRFDRIQALAERNREDISILIQGQTRLQDLQVELGQTQVQLAQTQQLLTQNLIELRAGQQRQYAILDWLIRQQWRNGGENIA